MKFLVPFLSLLFSTLIFAETEGTYSIDVEALREAIKGTPDYLAAPEAHQQMMEAVADKMKLSLTLVADGTFTAVSDMMGRHNEAGGTYAIEEGELVLTTTHENGAPKPSPEMARFKVVGDTFVIEEEGMPFSFVLRKSE